MTFEDLEFRPHFSEMFGMEGIHAYVFFKNGYGATVGRPKNGEELYEVVPLEGRKREAYTLYDLKYYHCECTSQEVTKRLAEIEQGGL